MMASLNGHNTIVELLLSKNADPNLKNNVSLLILYTGMQLMIAHFQANKTAYDLSKERRHNQVCALLLPYRPKPKPNPDCSVM